jgi:hypothetical protein
MILNGTSRKLLNQFNFFFQISNASLENFCSPDAFTYLLKKLVSILLALFILLSGMNLSIARHFCNGEIAATLISFSGKKATCGMLSEGESVPVSGTSVTRLCCEDKTSVYAIDKNYSPSQKFYNSIVHIIIPCCNVSENFLLSCNDHFPADLKNNGPPGYFAANSVNRTEICNFRF